MNKNFGNSVFQISFDVPLKLSNILELIIEYRCLKEGHYEWLPFQQILRQNLCFFLNIGKPFFAEVLF